MDVGNVFRSISNLSMARLFPNTFCSPADWCGIGLRSWLPLFKEPEGEKRGKVVQLLEKRKISGEESIELVGAVGDRNDKH